MRCTVVALLLVTHRAEFTCNVTPFITVNYGGRLGNCIWEFMSLYAVAKVIPTPHEVYSQALLTRRVQTIFDNVTLPLFETFPEECRANLNLKHGNVGLADLVPMSGIEERFANNTGNIVLPRCIVLLESVVKYMEELKRVFPYKKQLVVKASDTLREIGQRFANKTGAEKYVFVGVHIRRTDYLQYLPSQNLSTVSEWYYKFAMEYFKNRTDLGRPIFVIATDDPVWAAMYYKGDDVFITPGDIESPQADLVLLSMCNHSIIDYGTYGLWAAVYAGGETVTVYFEGYQYQEAKLFGNTRRWHFVDPATRRFV